MCFKEAVIKLDGSERSARSVELVDLCKIAEHLRDLASYLAKHELEHEAAYVMMAFGRVDAKLARWAERGGRLLAE